MTLDDSTTRGQVYDLLRRRHIRTDLELTYENGVYCYRGQSALAPALRTNLRIYRHGRKWVIEYARTGIAKGAQQP